MIRATTLNIGNLPSYKTDLETYDPDKLGLGPLMIQKTDGGDSFAGPNPIAVLRPMEASVPFACAFPAAFQWSNTVASQWDWVFSAENTTAGNTRRIAMSRYDRTTGIPTYDGFITVTFPGTAEAKTVRGLRLDYRTETSGTVGVASGSIVTGVNTGFSTTRVCVGNRIGFGSTKPEEITQWSEILSIETDTSLTLTAPPGVIATGTPYVIEDLRLVVIASSLTTSNSGIYIVKGLRREIFSATGTTIAAATTIDKIRAVYYLKAAATNTSLAPFGAALEDQIGYGTRVIWLLDTLANPVLFKFNLRSLLTLTAGGATNPFYFKTGGGGAVTGVTSQLNNGRLANAKHGPGNNLNCIYFTTTTRIYRTADVNTISGSSTSWLIDNMTEVPPGSINTFVPTGGIQSIEYASSIDRFIVTSNGLAGARSYLSQYRTDGGQMDRIIFADFKQQDQGSADSTTTPFPSQLGSGFTAWVENGMAYLIRTGTTAALNQMYCVPLGADWEYASSTGSRIIFPRMSCVSSSSFIQAFVQAVTVIGGNNGKNLGMSPQPFRLYYRTAGIDSNTGGWALLPASGDMSAVAGAAYVQFMAEFRIDNTMIPARILNLGVVYNDTSMSVNWQGSGNVGTSLAAKQFGFRHSVAYGKDVPRLKVELYDAETGSLLGSDDSVTAAWSWQKTTDTGTTWVAYNTADRTNANTYIRVAPVSLADNIKVRAVLREF